MCNTPFLGREGGVLKSLFPDNTIHYNVYLLFVCQFFHFFFVRRTRCEWCRVTYVLHFRFHLFVLDAISFILMQSYWVGMTKSFKGLHICDCEWLWERVTVFVSSVLTSRNISLLPLPLPLDTPLFYYSAKFSFSPPSYPPPHLHSLPLHITLTLTQRHPPLPTLQLTDTASFFKLSSRLSLAFFNANIWSSKIPLRFSKSAWNLVHD